MKYIDVFKGQTISVAGHVLTYVGREGDTVILKDVRTGKQHIYGFETLKRIIGQYGYRLAE